MTDHPLTLNPIGRVVVDSNGFALQIDEAFRPALTALDGFSHINVLWWFSQFDEPALRELTISNKPYKMGPASVGTFATRSPVRPNPIALTAASLISIDMEAGILRIGYIDADDGTPILDIKPYLPAVDRVRQVQSPEWSADWPQWYEDSASFDWEAVFANAQ